MIIYIYILYIYYIYNIIYIYILIYGTIELSWGGTRA
jgi:hypothetical protein